MKNESHSKQSAKDYFNRARSWADDNFSQLQQSRNRYQLAFLMAMSLNVVCVISITVLSHLQTLIPIVLHHYENGVTTVDAPTHEIEPPNKAQVESDIAHYVINRESYDMGSYRAQFDLISILSTNSVNTEYMKEQDKSNKDAPINLLGVKANRQIHIYTINHLDGELLNANDITKNHYNLAEVTFTQTDVDKTGALPITRHYSAVVGWQYVKPSDSPAVRWQNWAGFQVFRYSKSLRNVEQTTLTKDSQ